MKRILSFMIAVMLIASLAMTASAATTVQDGIKIEMVTDKDEYSKGEKITATLTVTNTNEFDATDVSLEGVVPGGYKVRNANKLKIATLAAGETKTIDVVFVAANNILWIILAIVLVVAAAAVGFFLLRGKLKRVTAAVLCLAMVAGMFSTSALAMGNEATMPEDYFPTQSTEETTEATEATTEATETETTAPTEAPGPSSGYEVTDNFNTFAPSVGAMPTTNKWYVSAAANATKTADGKLQVKNLYYHIPEGITEDFTVEFKYQLPSDVRAKIVVGKDIQTTNAQTYMQFTGGGEKYGDRVNFNKGNFTTNVNYIFEGKEQWHTVQIAIKNSTKTYKMFVDGKQVNHGTDVEFDFYNAITKTNNIVFNCDSGKLMLDDFKIFKGEPVVKEAPSIEDPTNYQDDFSDFQPTVSANAPIKNCWWLTSDKNATQTEDGKLQVTNMTYSIPAGTTKDYTLEFKYQLPSDVSAQVIFGKGIETSNSQVRLKLTGGGEKYADRVNFNKGNVTSNVNYIFGGIAQWHTVQIAVSNSTKTYKLFVDGKQINYGTDLEFAFYNDITKTNTIIFQCTSGDLMMDDFKVFLGEPEVEKVPVIADPINYTDDFSDFKPVVSGTAPITNNWWLKSEDKATKTDDGKLKVTELYYNVPDGITKDYTLEFKYQLPSDVSAQVIFGKGIETSNSQVRLKLTGGGEKYADRVNFNKGNVTSNVNYIFDGVEQWHTVQIAVSNSTKTYKLFVDGKQINYGTDLVFDFFSDIAATTKVIFKCDSGNLMLDDFKVFLGEPEVEKIPSIEDPTNYVDDFSAFKPVVSGTAPITNNWWLKSEDKATKTDEGNLKVTELYYNAPDGITKDYTVEFKYQIPSDVSGQVIIGTGIETSNSQVRLKLTGGGEKYEDRVNFNKGDVTSNVNYIYGGIAKWHTVQIAVSNSTKTYKLFVDGKQVNYGTDVEFAFFSDITKTTKVIFKCDSGNLMLDDFRVFLGEPEIDEGPVITNPGNYSDNFSNFQTMVSKNAPLKSYWWITSENNAVQTANGKVRINKELNYYVPQGIEGSYTVEFKYQLPKNGRAYLKMGENVQTTTLQVYMGLTGGDDKYDDRIKLYDGEKDITEIFSGIGLWHTVQILVEPAKNIYHVFFDGELLANDYGLYVQDISTLKRITWQSSTGDLLIDDFKITPGIPKFVVYDYTPVPGSDLIYEATFDNWALGEIKGRQYKRWKASSKPDDGYTTSVMEVEGNRVLRIDQGEKGSYPTASYTFKEPMTTSFTLEVRLKQHPSAAGQISIQPASGGYGKAGPDLRFSESGTNWYTLNGYRFAASDKAEDGWNIISVYVNMDLHTYDVYCNGSLMEEAIPFRNRETSELTHMIIGHATKDQPGTTDIDYIRIYKGMKIIESTAEMPSLDGFEQLDAQIVAPRNPIPSNYSDVNLSTRQIRSDGSGGHEGSLDILKQFMVTYDRWVYSSSSDVTHRVTDLGVNMQQSVSPTSFFVSGVDTNAKWYDGTDFYFAWIKGSNHGCLNNPYALEERLNVLKTAVEDGSRSIQCDDPMYNWEFYKTGGCWCKYCAEKFTEYLLETYTTEELKAKAPNVTITSSFNYRQYLEKTYGWVTNDDYSTNRHLDPLEPYYEEFQKVTTLNYHTFVKEYLNSLGYGEIRYSANFRTASMELSATDEKKNAHYAIFTDSMPETNIGIMTRDTLNLAGIIDDALGRDTIFGVIPADGAGNLQKLRMAAVISYAMGTQAMIPWDTYVSSSHREWSSVEEVGDLYHFVRQYPYLFDDYKVPAIVGIAMDPSNGEHKTAVNTLSKAGITVKALPYMTAGKYANYTFTAEDVEGLKYVLEMASLPQDLKQLVTDSGAETVQMYPILGDQDNLRITWVENGNDDLYNTVRSYNGDFGAATSIHVVNGTNGIAYNTVVGINRQYLPKGNYSAVLYRPCYDPVVLDASSYGRDVTINASESIKLDGSKMKLTVKVSCTLDNCVFYTVDEMNEWSILHIVPEGATEGVGAFDISSGWSSISLGTGLAEGDIITNNGDNSFTMTTKYLGDNVRTESDRTGSQDMMPFVYKNVTASKLMDYAIEAKVSAFGNSGVMIREYPSSNARQVSLYLENGKLMAAARITDNKTMFYREIMDVTQDMYLKIVKTSASFAFYASVDGQDWGEKLISVDMLMDKPLAGVFSFSGDGQSVANTVSEVKLTELGIHENEEISDIVIPVEEKYFSEEYGDKLVISATTASGMTLYEDDFDTITYTSSDESIMQITDNRQIYGVSGGEATLTVVGTIGNYTITGSANISISSDGFVYLDENFDVWTPDTLGEGWSIQESAGAKNNTYIFSANHPSETDNSMGISDFSTFNATAFYSFGSTPIKRNHTIEFDYYLETELEGSEISNLNTLYISSPLGYMTCLFYERGYFKFYDNTLWHNICELAPNQWVHIQIDIDFQKQTNLFTITDSEGNVYQESYGLRNAGTSVTSLRFTTNTSAQGLIAYYDNLKVYVKGKTE